MVRWPVGGIRTFLRYVLNELPPNRFSFSIVAVETEGMKALREELSERLATIVTVPPDGAEGKNMLLASLKLVKSQSFDLIHAHGFTSNIIATLPSILSRKPLLCTSHDVINDAQFKGRKGWFKKAVLRFSLGRCAAVHSVSSDAQSNLRDFFPGLPTEKTVVIYNGIKSDCFVSASPQNLNETLDLDPEVPVIGFFGRFMGQKGFRVLVDAIEIIKKDGLMQNVHVACFGSGAFIREEQIDIDRRGLGASFSFIPFTADVSGMMKGCRVIAMPSLWEACPLQPMEALSAGVPFVGTNCLGLREVLQDTPAKVVPVCDAEALANAIAELVADGDLEFKRFAPLAAERFDISRTIAEIEALYTKVTQ
ncbi:glycosyltransferase family 4 protein [Marinobacter sp. JSM 1782161]|uniref:glycosyltransferase family 4 protein n=1 Tax=Marinobacter sp. JSM 1782161 TaxID=2685906 RepID=UPI001402FBFE|nr:glycosyltransferase family 4 protein [Marinobacter sp. JSM 1782161]